MNYPLEILKRHLRNELHAKYDCETALFESGGTAMNKETQEAFKESIRLADKRIPQLRRAIFELSKL